MKNNSIAILCLFITSLSFAQLVTSDQGMRIFNPTSANQPFPALVIFGHDDSNSNVTSHPVIELRNSGGESTAPTQTPSNKALGSLIFYGHDGTSFNQAGRIVTKTMSNQPYVNGDNTLMQFRLGGSTYGSARMTILGDTGNVGIGTQNPTELLSVNGKILCEEVEVIQDVLPDYVFEKYYDGYSNLNANYIMPSLEEVESFTRANYHLPDVPSAQEVKDNGMHLKEMTSILLQKIEELTLYTIEQEKRIKALEAKLQQ